MQAVVVPPTDRPKAQWLQQLDAIQASQARIEGKLDTLIKALSEDLDEVSQSLDDGRTVARPRDETQGL